MLASLRSDSCASDWAIERCSAKPDFCAEVPGGEVFVADIKPFLCDIANPAGQVLTRGSV